MSAVAEGLVTAKVAPVSTRQAPLPRRSSCHRKHGWNKVTESVGFFTDVLNRNGDAGDCSLRSGRSQGLGSNGVTRFCVRSRQTCRNLRQIPLGREFGLFFIRFPILILGMILRAAALDSLADRLRAPRRKHDADRSTRAFPDVHPSLSSFSSELPCPVFGSPPGCICWLDCHC